MNTLAKKTKRKAPLLILAPMAGITDLAFREICLENGADVVYSEMVSAAALFYEQEKTLAILTSSQKDQPLGVQLFGNEPKHFAKATQVISSLPSLKKFDSENKPSLPINISIYRYIDMKKKSTSKNRIILRKPEGIDINFGCPAKKIIKQNAGCFLMKDLKLSRAIVEAVTKNTDLPVSIKIRAGIEKIDAMQFLENIADLPWQTVIVHGRTFKEGFLGEIDFELIGKIKESFPEKKVIANGGIFSPEKAEETLEKTNADGLAIARGALGNPWIFRQIKDFLQKGTYEKPTLEEKKETIKRQLEITTNDKPKSGLMEMRKHFGWYFKNMAGAKEIRKALFEAKTKEEALEVLKKI